MKKDKTNLSCIWQIRLFGRDWLFGYIKIAEAAENAEQFGAENTNDQLEAKENKE